MLRTQHLANLPTGNALQNQPSSLMSFNYNNPIVPIERGAMAVRARNDFFRNLWGVPEDLARQMESNSNLQAMDIISQYKDRALEVPSNQLTAMILNGQASWLSDTAAPIFPTAEFNFKSSFREMNMIEFTRTAAGGIPNEQTYRTTSWKDTIEKVQLNARLEMDLSLDPNYGEDLWMFHLAGLAANAMLTIHKTIAYSILHIAYTNLVGDNVKTNMYDLSKILAKEEEYFGIAAFDQVKYLRMIRRMEDVIMDMDTVIIPHNSVCYISELLGESTSMQSQKVVTDPVSGNLEWHFAMGKKSVKTVMYGEKMLHFVEMPQFRVNMDVDDKEQPLRTSVTVAQVYPCDPDIKAEGRPNLIKDGCDIRIFAQSKSQGDEAVVSIKDAYNASFYFDEDSKTGDGLSKYAHAFCRFKTQTIVNDNNLIPWDWNEANPKRRFKDHDINREPEFDHNTPNIDYIYGKEKIQDMRGWRDQFFGVTYIPEEKAFRLPKRIADFELAAIPNKWIHKSARAIASVANKMSSFSMDFDTMMDETYELLDDIANAEWTDDYIVALINANIDKMYNYNDVDAKGNPKFAPTQKKVPRGEENLFPNASRLDEWVPNRFGSLNLPKKTGRMSQTYPPGFDNGPGLLTLSKEADDDSSEWKEVGARAKRVVVFWDMFARLIREYIGPSDVINACLTPPWFHVNSETTVLIDSFRNYKAPVFLAVPATMQSKGADEARKVNAGQLDKDSKDAIKAIKTINSTAETVSSDRTEPIDNVAKFVSILDTYTKQPTSPVVVTDKQQLTHLPDIGQALISKLSTPEGKTELYSTLVSKLVAYTVENVYNKPEGSSSRQLNIVTFIAHRINKATTTDALRRVGKDLDVFINHNLTKNTGKEAIRVSDEVIEKEPLLIVYNKNNSQATIDTIKLIKDSENLIRENGRKEAAKIGNTNYSYDEQLEAVNNYKRYTKSNGDPIDNLNEEERARLDNANARLTDEDRTELNQSTRGSQRITVDPRSLRISTYLRSPLTAGDRLFEYLQKTSKPLVKPSDPYLFHEAVLDVVNDETMSHSSFNSHKKGSHVACSVLPHSHTHRHGHHAGSYNSNSGGGSFDIFDNSSNRTKKSYSSTKMDINQFISKKSMSQGFDARNYDDMMDDDYGKLEQRKQQQRKNIFAEDFKKLDKTSTLHERLEAEAKFEKYLSKEEYFGPHKGRNAYADKHISSPFEKAIFKAIMLAPNRITIHLKLADIGQKLVNVLIFRLFIQHIMSSTIIMKAGKDTLRTAVGHGKVWLNTEQRGINIINAGFYLGTYRVNPGAIQMLPFTFPEGFVGGMNLEFMKDISHFKYKTTDKESMIAVLSPVQESRYEYPLHILNLPTYARRDTNNAPHLRKWSSSEFLSFVLNQGTLYEVQGHIEQNKKSYGHAFDISLCAHRGPVRYIDQDGGSGKLKAVPGTGPRGNFRMNVHGAEKTWNGESVKFPDVTLDQLRQ